MEAANKHNGIIVGSSCLRHPEMPHSAAGRLKNPPTGLARDAASCYGGAPMFWFIYNLVFHLVYLLMLPRFLLRMRRRGGYRRDFGERLFRVSEDKRRRLSEGRKIWIHAVSVGELTVGLAFMREWRRRRPEAEFLLTVNTSTAHEIARKKLGPRDVLLYPPLDSPPVVRRMLDAVEVEALVLVETEMWPNLLRLLRRRGVPAMLLNGRISDRSFRRLRKVPFYTRRLYPLVSRYCMQSGEDATRAIGLGAPEERVKVMHSAKYDVAERNPAEEKKRLDRLIASGFMEKDSVILLGSSTWPGEEKVLMRTYWLLKADYPDLRLILVPRHFERRAEVLADAEALGLRLACWSEATDEALGRASALMVDTTGELMHFTGIADRVFVGKSLFRPEGQNPIEAANAGKFVVTGPGMDNFRRIIQDLRVADAVREARDPGDLRWILTESLKQPDKAWERGERAKEVVACRKGSLARSADVLEALLNSGG